jgi:hypothetical protein
VIYKSRETNSLKRLYIKAKANKLKLTDNGCVRNHKLQGSQPNTKQKLRQVAIMGANWSMKKARMQNHMSIMQHTKSARVKPEISEIEIQPVSRSSQRLFDSFIPISSRQQC